MAGKGCHHINNLHIDDIREMLNVTKVKFDELVLFLMMMTLMMTIMRER